MSSYIRKKQPRQLTREFTTPPYKITGLSRTSFTKLSPEKAAYLFAPARVAKILSASKRGRGVMEA